MRSAAPIARAIDWHSSLEGRAAYWFDAISMLAFAALGIALTWQARGWVPGGWWQLSGSSDTIVLTLVRMGVAALGGLAVFAAAIAGSRFGLVEVPGDKRWLMAAKFVVAALMGCGVLMIYHDPALALLPMVGLMMIALILIFRMEPSDAIKVGLAIALVMIPSFQAISLI